MRCQYCFYADEMAHRSMPLRPPMSLVLLETLIRKACAYADGVLSLSFQGGEPTLAGADFFREVVRLEKRYGREGLIINNAVQTNGYDLPDDLIDLLAKEHFLVGVSLDGTQCTHDALRLDAHGEGTWTRVREKLRRMKGRDVEFNILCLVNGEVAKHGAEVMDTLAPYEYLQFIPCMDGLDGTETPGTLSAEAYGTFLCDTFPLYQCRFGGKNHISVRTFDNWLNIDGKYRLCAVIKAFFTKHDADIEELSYKAESYYR